MDKCSMIKDFFIESLRANLTNLFSFDLRTELQSDEFSNTVLNDLFINRIPVMMQIISRNVAEDCSDTVYALIREKVKEKSELIDRLTKEDTGHYHSAKLNGVKFKIGGSAVLITMGGCRGNEVRDELRRDVMEFIRMVGYEALGVFFSEFVSAIDGIERCVETVKQVLELGGVPKEIVAKFTETVNTRKASIELGMNTTTTLFVSPFDMIRNDDKGGNTFLSKKRNPSKPIQTVLEANDPNGLQSEKGKNKSIEDYFKIKGSTAVPASTATAKPVNPFNASNAIVTPYKKPTITKKKRKLSQVEEEPNHTPPRILDFLTFERAAELKRSNNKLSSLLPPSLTNSFNKSTTYSNSFNNFEVTSFHNSEISSISKTTLSIPAGFRGINSRLGSSSMMQKFSVKKKKKPKKNSFSERLIEKCRPICDPTIKAPEEPKPKNDSKLNHLRKMIQKNFYSVNSNNTSLCNSRENSNSIPWSIAQTGKKTGGSQVEDKGKNRPNENEDDNLQDREGNRKKEDSDDEVLVYKTPEKKLSTKFDYSDSHNILKRNLYALFTQTLN